MFALVLAALALSGCTIEVGPPPESDPPLVPQKAKAPPPPPQPTEPQPWSRDLDLDSGPTRIDEDRLAQGLVASNSGTLYTSERLTFESAYNDEAPPSEADLARARARARAEAAGRPVPPEVAAAPVEEVRSQALPPAPTSAEVGESEASSEQSPRKSRLPPPPKFPPVAQEAAVAQGEQPTDAGTEAPVAAEPVAEPPVSEGGRQAGASSEEAVSQLPETAATPISKEEETWRESRLPPPPQFPPLPQEDHAPTAEAAGQAPQENPGAPAGGGPEHSEAMAAESPGLPAAAAAAGAFAAEAWEAPTGTILVQVSAVQKEENVFAEWERLKARYPEVLKPLRLVVEEAKLGDRGVFYRVQAGGFGSEASANTACGTLIDAGQACFVVVR